MASKMLLPPDEEMQLMDTRIASRAIATIQVISLVAIIIVMGMIVSLIGASIYGSLASVH
jgi:hypothetical protein